MRRVLLCSSLSLAVGLRSVAVVPAPAPHRVAHGGLPRWAAPALPQRASRCATVHMQTEVEVDAEVTDLEAEMRGALQQTAVCVAAACVFCAGVFATQGGEQASAWFAAYVLEESLSIDNLFVFSLIFDYFQTPAYAQPRVLRWGLIVAVVLRAAFILAGLAVVERPRNRHDALAFGLGLSGGNVKGGHVADVHVGHVRVWSLCGYPIQQIVDLFTRCVDAWLEYGTKDLAWADCGEWQTQLGSFRPCGLLGQSLAQWIPGIPTAKFLDITPILSRESFDWVCRRHSNAHRSRR